MASRNNKVVVPQSREALRQMKFEIASELGLMVHAAGSDMNSEFAGELGSVPQAASGSGYVPWDSLKTRDAGSVGGEITRRLIQQAEQTLGGLH